MTAGQVTVGFLHPGEYAACFANSLIDLLMVDLLHGEGRMAHAHGRLGNEVGANQIITGRNELARATLDGTGSEWLFMVDSDMGFAPDTVERLIASADPDTRPVVGGLAFACKGDGNGDYGARRYRATPTVYRMYETDTEIGFVPTFDYPRNTLIEVDATGAACVLVHRSALQAIRDNYGDCWFDAITLPKGKNGRTTFGEDLAFCLRLKACGIPVFVDTSVKTTHDKGGVFLDEEFYDLQQIGLGGRVLLTASIDVVIPTVGRPDRLADLAFNVIDRTPNLASLTFVVEEDDEPSIMAIMAIPSPKVQWFVNEGPRTYAGAINTAAARCKADWLFTGADDLAFHANWDTAALRLAAATRAKVIGTNDLGNGAVLAGHHSTHSLVSMDYVRAGLCTVDGIPGKVLHDYDHNYVDTELVAVAKARGVYVHCHAAKVEHLHPFWGKGESDATYEAGMAHFDDDKAEFERRMAAFAA